MYGLDTVATSYKVLKLILGQIWSKIAKSGFCPFPWQQVNFGIFESHDNN